MHISIASEILFNILGLDITNTIFTAFIVVIIIIIFSFYLNRKLNYANPGKLQIFFEMIIGYLGATVYELLGKRRGDKLLGFLFTFLFLILVSNWFGLLPIVPTLVVNKPEAANEEHASVYQYPQKVSAEEVPTLYSTEEAQITSETTDNEELAKAESSEISLSSCLDKKDCYLTISGIQKFEEPVHILRAPTTDLSMTIALAILAVVSTSVAGFKVLKLKYLKKFFNFSNPMDGVVGILELLSEFIKIISFSFRLFGNIFAGELLLTIITGLTYGVATLPFMFLEIFVGFIQAVVFFMLLAIFISLAIQDHTAEH